MNEEVTIFDLIFIGGTLCSMWLTRQGFRNEKRKTIQKIRSRGRARRAGKAANDSVRHYKIQRRNNRKFHWTCDSL